MRALGARQGVRLKRRIQSALTMNARKQTVSKSAANAKNTDQNITRRAKCLMKF